MIKYPLLFAARAEANSSTQEIWSSEGPGQSLMVAIPPEFAGPGGGWSPEDLYLQALQSCFLATFKVYAEKSKLAYKKAEVTSSLELDRDESGAPWMARAKFNVTLSGVLQKDNAHRILEKVSKACMILNSVKTEKIFNFHIQSE